MVKYKAALINQRCEYFFNKQNVLVMNKDYKVQGNFCSILYTHIHTSGFQSFGISQL